MPMRCKLPLLAAVSLFFALPAIRATTLAQLSLDQLAGAADGVARVRCAGTESRWENGAIWTNTTFEVVQAMKGDLPPRIVVRLPGGKVGPFTTTVEGAPRFSTGEEAVVFLERSRAGGYSVTGWLEGTFRIALDATTHREMVTQDSSSFALFDAATRTFRAEGMRKIPIEIFRARLEAAIAKAQEKTR
jgi:hypothetical protein